MKKNSDEAKLIEAVLADESWESCSARMHGDGLAALRAAKKSRAGWRAAGQAVMLFALLGAVWWTFKGDGSQQRGQNVSANLSSIGGDAPRDGDSPVKSGFGERSVARPGDSELYITDEQMLAMFPKGSCVIAEVDGQKELVFVGGRNDRYPLPNSN